jgi:16S rRNA (uracil1498-N3)-methyltransferase
MSAGRFFVAPTVLGDPARVVLPLGAANQVRAVLRLRAGDRVTLLDGTGMAYTLELAEVSRERVVGRVVAQAMVTTEPRVPVILYQGLLKAAKFEWIVQKGTEIGLSAIVPVQCRRSVVGADAVSAAKLARWRAIAAEAAEQSDRGRVPAVRDPVALGWSAHPTPQPPLHRSGEEEISILAYEAGDDMLRQTIRDALAGTTPTAIHLYIGPEGGFAPEEVAMALAHGVRIVTLGPRILRAETAALVAATLALDAVGEIA